MKNKIAIVTGAANGIGAEVCRQLSAAGARVVLLDVNVNAGKTLANSLGGTFIECNVTDPQAWSRAVDACITQVGVPDYVHLNAGVMSVGADAAFPLLEQLPLASYRRIMGVNLDGVVFGLQALLPHMRGRDGAITVTASIAGLVSLPIDPLYSATKHALIGLVRSVADTLAGTNLRLNAICPGAVDTAIVPTALRAGDISLMSPTDLAREVIDLLAQGKSGEIRVKLSAAAPAFVVPQTALG